MRKSPGHWLIGLPFYVCAALQLTGTTIAYRHFRRKRQLIVSTA